MTGQQIVARYLAVLVDLQWQRLRALSADPHNLEGHRAAGQ
jgi:hypothetical protein